MERTALSLGAWLLALAVGASALVPACVRADPPSPLDQALKELEKAEGDSKAKAGKDDPHKGHRHAHHVQEPAPGARQGFLSSWELFRNTYLAGGLIALLLSLLGVALVARNQIFFGAAVSEASTLGIAVGLGLTGTLLGADVLAPRSESILAGWAIVFAVGAALATSRIPRRETHEAVTGWVFLASASLSVLVVMHSPHGMQEVQRLHASSLIGASTTDVFLFATLLLASVAGVALARRRLLLVVLDPEMAAAVGLRVGLWNAFLLIWLGLAVGLSIRAAGTLYTFGCLVLPALVAKPLCREAWQLLIASPSVALLAAALGFFLGHELDAPPAQTTVGVLAILWGVAAAATGLAPLLRKVASAKPPSGPH